CSSPEAVAGLLRRRRAAATALGRGSRAAVLQFAELGLEVGLQPGAVFALEGAKRLDLLLQRVLLLRDVAHHLGVLALGVALQVGRLLPSLPLEGLRPGAGVVEHRLGSRARLV